MSKSAKSGKKNARTKPKFSFRPDDRNPALKEMTTEYMKIFDDFFKNTSKERIRKRKPRKKTNKENLKNLPLTERTLESMDCEDSHLEALKSDSSLIKKTSQESPFKHLYVGTCSVINGIKAGRIKICVMDGNKMPDNLAMFLLPLAVNNSVPVLKFPNLFSWVKNKFSFGSCIIGIKDNEETLDLNKSLLTLCQSEDHEMSTE